MLTVGPGDMCVTVAREPASPLYWIGLLKQVCVFVCVCVCVAVAVRVCLCVCLYVGLSFCPSLRPHVRPYVSLSVYLILL